MMFLTDNHHSPQKGSPLNSTLFMDTNRILAKHVKACINKFYRCFDLRVVFQSPHRIMSLFPYKERLTRAQMSRVAYTASC